MKTGSGSFVLSCLVVLTLAGLAGCKRPETAPALAAAPSVSVAPRSKPMTWRVATAHLEDLFAQIPNSSIDDFRRETPEEERARVNASHGEAGLKDNNAHVYGEPAPATTDLMLDHVGINEQDVLYDLGCGRGFFLMQALLTKPLRKAVGVELATSRIEIGKRALALMLAQGLMPPGKTLDLQEGDMTKANLEDATVVYLDSVFFSDELLLAVARNMAKAKDLRSVVMIMKGLPANPWFELDRKERLKMSWSPKYGSEVLYYKRTAAPAE